MLKRSRRANRLSGVCARVRLLMQRTWYTKLVYHTLPSGVIRSVIPFRMVRRFLRTLLGIPAPLDGATLSSPVVRRDDELTLRIEKLERAEATRAAEHAAMVDQLDRLYKRVSARIARADRVDREEPALEESVLSLKQRLQR